MSTKFIRHVRRMSANVAPCVGNYLPASGQDCSNAYRQGVPDRQAAGDPAHAEQIGRLAPIVVLRRAPIQPMRRAARHVIEVLVAEGDFIVQESCSQSSDAEKRAGHVRALAARRQR